MIVGLGLLIWAYSLTSSQITFIQQSKKAPGTVVENYIDSEGEGYFPVVKFRTPDGNIVKFRENVGSSPPKFQIGQYVDVLYDPSNPENAQINAPHELWLAPKILGVVGMIFFTLGIFSVYSELKNKPFKKAQTSR